MSMFDPARAHIRAIQPSGDDGVRLIVDEVREHIITGSPEDDRIRHLLVAATKDPNDPAIRVDSLDVLKRSGGEDIRDVLLDSVQHDPNAGVRLKALEALSRFADDGTTRRTLTSVLSRDENADVRTQAIELLVAPQDTALPPQLTRVLENMMHSDPDEYIRMRCQQALHSPRGSVHVY
jgi:HEAT repeat protein